MSTIDKESLLRHLDFRAQALRHSDDRRPNVRVRERAGAYESIADYIRSGIFDSLEES